ncbi:MAG: cytochrome C peroxidase [Alteromonadaceae bacterium]|nr:MAG: cytochrome C peroxidase [Alteromonadaceae bacterium]
MRITRPPKTLRIIAPALCLLIVLLSSCGGGSGATGNNTGNNTVDTPTNNTSNDTDNGTINDDIVEDNTDNNNTDNDNTEPDNDPNDNINDPIALTGVDQQLLQLINGFDWDNNPLANRDLPSIDNPIAQLGKKLFFSKSLGGGFDAACASCHHPSLGGADQLSLAVGVDAINPDLLGRGRAHNGGLPRVPRNSPTNFNAGLWDSGMFFDSRVESLGKDTDANGRLSGIRTPDTPFLNADPNAGDNLVAAQARFPVTSADEMKTNAFEVGGDNADVRAHLAARIGNYGVGEGELARNQWLREFQQAFGVTTDAENLVTFDNIAHALGEYQRSLVFINNPWQNYLEGDVTALTNQQKNGALLFFTSANNNGAGCSSCHKGSLFSDEQHHTVAFPQIGSGKGDANNDDFGRERETGEQADRYRFRTPSLLNITHTAPYGHSGSYQNLRDVIRHYVNPADSIEDYFDDAAWCNLDQFSNIDNCENLYPFARVNSENSLAKLRQERNANQSLFDSPRLNNNEINSLVAFLQALTDPCIESRQCLAPWIADETNDNPDDQILIGTDLFGELL